MDLAYRVFIYIILANLAYMILSLLRQGFKHYSAYIGQLSVLVTLIIWMLVKDFGAGTTLLVALIGTFILVILPIIFQRHIDALMAEGHFEELGFYTKIKAAIAWSSINAHLKDIAECAGKNAENLDDLEKHIRELLGQGEPYDGLTRVFLGFIHFSNRNFNGLIADLRVANKDLKEHSFDELIYLVRAYVETTRYEEAIEAQFALETKVSEISDDYQDLAEDKQAALAVSRMIFLAFLGWMRDFDNLIRENHEGIAKLPEALVKFWQGVCYFNGGDYDNGEKIMYEVIKSASTVDENDPWLPFMRNRLRGLIDNKDFFNNKVLPELKKLQDKNSNKLGQIINEQTVVNEKIEPKSTVTNLLVVITALISIGLMSFFDIEDTLDLLNIGANSSFLVNSGEYFRLFTHQFVHIGFLHLFMNIVAIKYFAPPVETVAGWPLMLGIYFFSGIGGGFLAAYNGQQLSAGASGAVFGLLASSLVFEILAAKNIKKVSKRPSQSTLLFILGINLLIGFVEKNIDNWAHIGGLCSGAFIALILLPILKNTTVKKLVSLFVLLSLVFVGITSVKDFFGFSNRTSYPQVYGKMQTIKSSSDSLNLMLPITWSKSEIDSNQYNTIYAVGPLGELMTVTVFNTDETALEFAEALIKERKKEIENTDDLIFNSRKGPEKKLLNNKLEAYVVQWSLTYAKSPRFIADYFVTDGDTMFYFKFMAATANETAYLPMFDHIVASTELKINFPKINE